ncbi:CP family cyanate transporter-like MFS transporter [Gemmobacter caeni]|uniref:CP family cyanate transporter-like MFS transporter n=2 Tax=Pseudomonadota TaxID=1224 RepID=A0A2T6B8K6_9RHOB|nr:MULTISPECIES: CynX/NimT family MFS transporter [Pseudomonadota]EJU0637228.1 CynX/NimT family MFS transporter [Salmonella enterica]PTX52407.1 CP family cyanate transporter-like MFS transporter [Gemmobacter caeni]TWJ02922.1 CP family cyanate transporter-like MFS transporter [Gemmobacter caeni]
MTTPTDDGHAPAIALQERRLEPEASDTLIDIEVNESPMPAPAPSAGTLFLACSLILVAFNLRTIFPSLGALLPELKAALNLSSHLASWVTTLPVLCLGLFAPLAPWLARRIGAERTIFCLMIALSVGVALRGAGGLTGLLCGSVLAGAAIAIINVLLPGLIKRDFPHATGVMAGLYAMALLGGAATAAGATMPLEMALGGEWTQALSLWCVPAAIACACWFFQLPRGAAIRRIATPRVRGLWRCPLAWQLTAFMVLQSMYSFTVFGWLAPFLRDRGIPAVDTSLIVSVSILLQTAACLAAPIIATRLPNQSWFNMVVVTLTVVGFIGCLAAPLHSVWFWAGVQGVGQGALTSIAMAMIVLRSGDAHVAAELSGMVQGVGYGLGASGPLLVGLLYEPGGGYARVGGFLVAVGLALLCFGYLSGRQRLVSVKVEPAEGLDPIVIA